MGRSLDSDDQNLKGQLQNESPANEIEKEYSEKEKEDSDTIVSRRGRRK